MSKSLFLDANVLYNIIQNRPNAKELKRVIAEYEFINDLEKLLSICHIIQTSILRLQKMLNLY